MTRLIGIIIIGVLVSVAYAKEEDRVIRVAVIDTGFDFKSKWKDAEERGLKVPKLCEKGHTNLTGYGDNNDVDGHGTHVAGIIAKYAEDANYCLVIIKVYHGGLPTSKNLTAKAIAWAIKQKADIINLSLGGTGFIFKEYIQIKKALNKGIVVVAAAGNNSQKVDKQVLDVKTKHDYQTMDKYLVYEYKIRYIDRKTMEVSSEAENTYFPAAYDQRVIAVVNGKDGKPSKSSNYGNAFDQMEDGEDVLSLLIGDNYGVMTGTSMAAPKKTGKLIKNWSW